MRVRISYTVSITDEMRRAINRFYGNERIATRAEVKEWYETYGGTMDEELIAEYGDSATQETAEWLGTRNEGQAVSTPCLKERD